MDPDFNSAHRAFYYVLALKNPTCRWSTWDALRAGVAPREDLQTTIGGVRGRRQFGTNPPRENGRLPANFLASVGCELLDQHMYRFAEYLSRRLPEPVG